MDKDKKKDDADWFFHYPAPEVIYPLPDAMQTFLLSSGVLDDPQGLLEDEILMREDDSFKLSLLKLVKTLVSMRGSCGGAKEKDAHIPNMVKAMLDLIVVDFFRDCHVWERLNVGHWKSVDPGWRRAYTFLSICKTIFMAVKNMPFKDIVKECDMGLLMGEPILGNVLLSFAQDLSKLIRKEGQETTRAASDCSDEEGQGQGRIAFEEVCLKMQHPESRFELECIQNPSLEQFSDIMRENRPILISDGIEHWPARKKWSVDYIRKTVGFRTVPVELGSKYTSDDWTQKFMTLNDFIESHMNPKNHAPNSSRAVGYVAQHRLFEQITELGEDIKTPDYCLLGESKQVDINAWFGPGNTISPMHFDPKHNILVQVFGTKLIRLYPPTESQYLNPFPSTSILFNTSQIDLEDSKVLDKYPDLKNARYCEFLLSPGCMLYMPPKWWHYVKSLTPSFSVSFWFE